MDEDLKAQTEIDVFHEDQDFEQHEADWQVGALLRWMGSEEGKRLTQLWEIAESSGALTASMDVERADSTSLEWLAHTPCMPPGRVLCQSRSHLGFPFGSRGQGEFILGPLAILSL